MIDDIINSAMLEKKGLGVDKFQQTDNSSSSVFRTAAQANGMKVPNTAPGTNDGTNLDLDQVNRNVILSKNNLP